MNKIVDFNKALAKKNSKGNTSVRSGDPVNSMLETDIENLASASGITKDEAVLVASRFYKLYPMLMEHVRSPEFMLRK